MKSIRPWLLLALVFFAGFAGGIVVTRMYVRHVVREAIRDPNYLRANIERRLTIALRLKPDQRPKVHEILVHAQAEVRALRGLFQPRFQKIMSQTEAEIAATLTPEQKRRLQRFKEQNRHLWPARGG